MTYGLDLSHNESQRVINTPGIAVSGGSRVLRPHKPESADNGRCANEGSLPPVHEYCLLQ